MGNGPIVTMGTVLGYPKCLSGSKSHGIRAILSCSFQINEKILSKKFTLCKVGKGPT